MLLALAYIAALGVALVFVSCAAKLNEDPRPPANTEK